MFCAVFITVVVVFEVLVLNFGIYFQRKYLGDAYDLLEKYSIHTNNRIKYKNRCFIVVPGNSFTPINNIIVGKNVCDGRIAVSPNEIYIKLDYRHLDFAIWGKLLRIQIPKDDFVFLQTKKLPRFLLFVLSRVFFENDYSEYRIADSSVTILVRSDIAQKLKLTGATGTSNNQPD
jgi:hypothetical protein